jgi:hypothetical protein
MQSAYRLFRRNNKYYYLEDNTTGTQRSLGTDEMREARKLLIAANDNRQAPDLNLHLGKTYLTHAELQFLAQGLVDLSGDTGQQLFPRHGERLTAQIP